MNVSALPRDRFPSSRAVIGGVEKRITTVEELNSRFALLAQDGSPSVYVHRRDFLPIQDMDLKRRLACEVVAIGTKDGRPLYTGAYKVWTENAGRHVFRRIAFSSQPLPDDTLNLYRGLGVTRKAGNCGRIINHVREVICSGNEADADAMLKLLAWQIQNVGKPSRVVVVLKSKAQQAGKGVLLGEVMAKIYGPSGFTAAATDQILGRFNSALRGRAFIFLDEVLFAGDRRAADAIKSLSTATVIGIEEKGLPVVQCPVAVNLWLASNHENAAHVEEDDARYWVLNVSPHRVGDAAYFSDLMNEIDNGGREAFAHYLLNLDVVDFSPARDVPMRNQTKAEMIRRSVNPYDARNWLEECARTERVIGMKHDELNRWRDWVEGDEYSFAALAAAYTEWMKTVKSPVAPKPTPIGNLGEILGHGGLAQQRDRTGSRLRVLPSVKKALGLIWSAHNER